MTYRNCIACKEAGTKPKRGKKVRIVYDPGITMPGPPTLEDTRLGAEFMARRVAAFGVEEAMRDYPLTREQVIVCCWWVGAYGNRRTKLNKLLREWAEWAGWHLWYGCINIPDPPMDVTKGGQVS